MPSPRPDRAASAPPGHTSWPGTTRDKPPTPDATRGPVQPRAPHPWTGRGEVHLPAVLHRVLLRQGADHLVNLYGGQPTPVRDTLHPAVRQHL